MTKEQYIQMTNPLRNHAKGTKILHISNKLATGLVMISYPLLLGYLLFIRPEALLRAILVPFVSFVLVSLVRKGINRPRPYEAFETPPVIVKETKGKSFPSRHVFSAFIIGMTFLAQPEFVWIAIAIFVLSVVLAIVRVVSGVHYISDVIAGALVGILLGIIGFYLI